MANQLLFRKLNFPRLFPAHLDALSQSNVLRPTRVRLTGVFPSESWLVEEVMTGSKPVRHGVIYRQNPDFATMTSNGPGFIMGATEAIVKAVKSSVILHCFYRSFSTPNGYLRLLLRFLAG